MASSQSKRDRDPSSVHANIMEKKEWYHGMLPREDISRMLKKQGQFLVRVTEPRQGQGLRKVVSVYWDNKVRHYIIAELQDRTVSIEIMKFPSIVELVDYYYNSKKPIAQKSGAKLLHIVPRQSWELRHDQIELGKMLGEGAFGAVHAGTLELTSGEKVKVAVKVNKSKTISKDTIKEICKEARIMRQYSHPNIVRFYGVAVEKDPIMLVMELVNDGALDSYLIKNSTTLKDTQRLNICFDAAKGLEYLHEKGCIHRDVAARNCLVSDGRVKISDFGLSQQLSKNVAEYKLTNLKQKLPIRWLSPETLTTAVYTSKSDVWSFGIMLWEVFSDGSEPYPNMTAAEVNTQVKSGYRMPPPENMPTAVRDIQRHCYPADQSERWTMAQIRKAFEDLCGPSTATKKSALSNNPESSYRSHFARD